MRRISGSLARGALRRLVAARRREQGYAFIETFLGACILIPVALFLLDLSVVIIANSINDSAVKNAARAAANQPDGGAAFNAARQSLASIKGSSIIKSIELSKFDIPASKESVSCQTTMVVRLPVPIGKNELIFVARAVEPMVGAK